VFPNCFGGFKNPRYKLRESYNLTEKVGLERIALHNLRHTHATHLLKEGVNPKGVQERFGHNHVGITLDIYSHISNDLQVEVAEKVGNAYSQYKKSREQM
jgi:integrase